MDAQVDSFYLGVKAVIKNHVGDILLLQAVAQAKAGFEAHWDLPGGKVHRGEAPEDALVREVGEETGLKANYRPLQITAGLSNFRNLDRESKSINLILLVYGCSVDEEEVVISEEHSNYEWLKADMVAERLDKMYPTVMIQKIIAVDEIR